MTNLVFAPPDLGNVLLLTGLPGGSNKIYDRSPYGNIGTITGAGWAKLPSGLYAPSFDGMDDYVNFGDVASVDGIAEITVMLWAKTTIDISNNQTFIGKWDALVGADHAFLLDLIGGQFRWGISSSGDVFISGGTPVQNKYHFLVGTYKTLDSRLFVDGAQVNQSNIREGNLKATAEELLLGCAENGGHILFLNGVIALVRIYNRVLSALEIQNIFNREKHLFGVW